MTATLEEHRRRVTTDRARTDLIRTVGVVGFAGLASVVPRKREAGLLERLGRYRVRRRPDTIAALGATIAAHLGSPGVVGDGRRAAESHIHDHLEELWGMGRGLLPGGWQPEYTVSGLENLAVAAEAGSGIVIWRMGLGPPVPLSLALGEAGHRPVHLTHENHWDGSGTWFSRRIAAPVLRRGEYRSVADRVVTSATGNMAAIREIRRRLLEGATVTMRGDVANGMKLVIRPFLDGARAFPVGAPGVAHQTGAALLTAAVVRTGPLHYRVFIDPPIDVDRLLERRDFQEEAITMFAARMAERIREHPWTLPRARRPIPAGLGSRP